MKRVIVLVLALMLPGCPSQKKPDLPETVADLRDVAVQCREEARSAREARAPGQADTVADRSEAAAEKAAALLAALAEPTEADRTARQEAAKAAREARRFARLAEEERRRENLVNGWKGRAYRGGRKVAYPAACNGLALAAEQAGKTDVKSLPDAVRNSAEAGADVARQYTGRQPLPNGQPDWPGVATDLRGLASAPPPELAHGLALAFVLTGKKEFALYEIELVDPATLRTRQQKTHHHLLRGLIYSTNGFPLLAGEEVEKVPALDDEAGASYGPELLAGVHLLQAMLYIKAKDYEQADREIVRALQVSPNNPIASFLTGERLAATGDYEKAADSLENATRGTDTEWLARKVAQRARELRDHPEKSETLLHDNGFVAEVMLHYLAVAAKNSETARQLQRSITAVQSLSKKVLEQLPGDR